MNPASGYMVFRLFANRAEIRELPYVLGGLVGASMAGDGVFSEAAIRRTVEAIGRCRVCRTRDRKTLAHINQVLKCGWVTFDAFYEAGGAPGDLEFGRYLNHSLYGPHWDPAKGLADLLGVEIPKRGQRELTLGLVGPM